MDTSHCGLYTVAAIRRIEQAAIASLPPGTLMQRAGNAAAALAESLLPRQASEALILAGPGNNGGDAFVAAARLAEKGRSVTVLFNGDPEKLPEDAKEAYAQARRQAIPSEAFSVLPGILEKRWDIVIDGLFGIGLSKAIASPYRELIEAVNRMHCPVLALDVPSGLDADTGALAAAGDVAVRATHTITFIADKPGLHTAHGRDLAGTVHVADLGVDQRLFVEPEIFKNEPALFSACLRPRLHNSHKGSYGNVAVLGGARGMHGAAVLSARAALHLGAGRVYVGFLDDAPAYDGMQPELMCRTADVLDMEGAAIIAGPGMGMSPHAAERLAAACSGSGPLVLDAD
ncbi:MAG: NAD(P)H-hydrate epimerase, partial [Burkholderiaceae bacterium]